MIKLVPAFAPFPVCPEHAPPPHPSSLLPPPRPPLGTRRKTEDERTQSEFPVALQQSAVPGQGGFSFAFSGGPRRDGSRNCRPAPPSSQNSWCSTSLRHGVTGTNYCWCGSSFTPPAQQQQQQRPLLPAPTATIMSASQAGSLGEATAAGVSKQEVVEQQQQQQQQQPRMTELAQSSSACAAVARTSTRPWLACPCGCSAATVRTWWSRRPC